MLDKNAYDIRKAREKEWAEDFVKEIKDSTDPYVRYRDSRPVTDIKNMIETSCAMFADNIAFLEKDKKGGEYRPIYYKQLIEDMNGLGTSLISRGLKGKRISIIGENSHKWAISYLSVLCGTGIVVPLDKELNENELEQLINEAEVSCVIFDKKHEDMFRHMKASGNNSIKILISMNAEKSDDDVLAFDELVKEGKDMVAAGDRSFTDAQIINDEMSVILFTSGTTGISKGVMLSHKNIAADLMSSPTVLVVRPEDRFFSFLPLHHTYECTCGFLMPLYKGASIAYCEGLKYIVKNLGEASPTMFLGVPAVFETIYKKIWQNAKKQGKDRLLRRVIGLNRKTKKIGIDLGNIFFKDIRAVLGGRMRMMICGGAAIDPSVLDGFMEFGPTVLQGYGLTEAAPIGALNPDTRPKSDSIGRPLPCFSAAIKDPGEDGIGEILLKGDNIMMGYYKRQDLTEEVLTDGWFHTGDLGYMDEEGYIYLTGRKKNVIITKNGKNVYPEELEFYLSGIPFVKESMVWEKPTSDGEDTSVAASIVIDEDALKELCPEKTLTDDEVMEELWKEVDKINSTLPLFKRIRSLNIRKEEFEKNSSKKIKRFLDENKN